MYLSGLSATIIFIAAACWAVLTTYKASRSTRWLTLALLWLMIQGLLSLTGFYQKVTMPPRLMIVTIPPLIFVLSRLLTASGRDFLARLDLTWILAYHLVRIPVELGLLFLAEEGKVPSGMTFENGNYDIFSGISALMIIFLHLSGRLTGKVLLLWNTVCLLLLLYIMVTANLSVPGPLQRLNFDQPNIGFRYFPAVWLPAFIAPMALLGHLAIFVKLNRNRRLSEHRYI